MRGERARRRAAVQRLQDGRLHLEVSAGVEKRSYRSRHLRARNERVANFRIYRQIRVPLAKSLLRIAETRMADDRAVGGDLFLGEW